MKICSNCGAYMSDDAKFCIQCGMAASNAQYQQYDPGRQYQQGQYNNQYQYQKYQTYDPYDHTAEFSPEDISQNKLYAILIYIASLTGIIIALLVDKDRQSGFLHFHIRQGIKLYIIEAIVLVITMILSWTVVFLVIGIICLVICLIIDIIAFVWACRGKAKEAPIIRRFGFLK